MTTPHGTPGDAGELETLSQAVARRLRGRMGELQLKGTTVAAAIGMTQASFSRRYVGEAPFQLDELQQLEIATGIRISFLLGLEDPTGETTITGLITKIEPAREQAEPPAADQQQQLPPAPQGPPRAVYHDSRPTRYEHGLWPGVHVDAARTA